MRTGLVAICLLFMSVCHADGFIYSGGITSDDPEVQLQDHICLSFLVFLEARGEGELSQIYHAMAGVNRALDSKRWSDSICGVLIERGQFESVKEKERLAITSVMNGDTDAIDIYIVNHYLRKRDDIEAWYAINRLTYGIISAKERTDDWLYADHFLVPTIIHRRGKTLPSWYHDKELLSIAGNTHFLKTKEYL